MSVFAPVIEAIKGVKNVNGEIQTKPFLDVCGHVLPVIDKFGAAFTLVKSDIGGNITRLTTKYASNPAAYQLLYPIVTEEVKAGTASGGSSNSQGLLWLNRAMEFIVALFRNLEQHKDWTTTQAANEAYNVTLKPYHGWIAQTAFMTAMRFIPNRDSFFASLGSGDLTGDIDHFMSDFSPLLAENHEFLKKNGLADLKA